MQRRPVVDLFHQQGRGRCYRCKLRDSDFERGRDVWMLQEVREDQADHYHYGKDPRHRVGCGS